MTIPRSFSFLASLIPVDEAGYRKLIETHKGKVTLVSFWATWCGPCRQELPALRALQVRYRNLQVLTISADEPENASKAQKLFEEAGFSGAGWIRSAQSDDAFISAIDRTWSGALPCLSV
ncbi:MAG: TlpA disulfide reductase family protein [Bryobacteraceae bacterium]